MHFTNTTGRTGEKGRERQEGQDGQDGQDGLSRCEPGDDDKQEDNAGRRQRQVRLGGAHETGQWCAAMSE
jgi:hypothetical protein